MKRSVLFFFAFLIILKTHAQNPESQSELSISIGPSFPTGSYGSKDATKGGGFAKTGIASVIAYNHLVKKLIGFSIELSAQQNGLNTEALEKHFSKQPISNMVFFSNSPGQAMPTGKVYPNWKFEKKAWHSASIMAGLYSLLPINNNDKIAVSSRLMIGVIHVMSPELKGSSVTDTATAHLEQKKGNATGFAYTLESGLRFKLNSRISALALLNYKASKSLKFEDITAKLTTTRGNPSDPTGFSVSQYVVTGSLIQKLSSVNILLGLSIRL